MELLLEAMGVSGIKQQHLQGKGNKKGAAGGFSFPWLLAARLLAAPESGRQKHLLTWPQLWDVLRWYAHNRGYDGNLRWSGDYVVHGYSPENKLHADVLGGMTKKPKSPDEAEDGSTEKTPKDKKEGEEDDSEKLKMGARLMGEYDFPTLTFAESVAKFLLGPDRTVAPPKLPGEAGQLKNTTEKFTKEEFHHKLFGLAEEYRNHPKHLQNYYKGLKAAFPRRHIVEENGKRILAGGTEWEVHTIIRAHFNAPKGKANCDATFERAICGDMPENSDDWKAYEKKFPQLYLSSADKTKLKQLRGSKPDSKEDKERKQSERKKITFSKIILPKRYQGGLLFGQLVPRFENRIIAECPVTYGRKLPMLLRLIDGEKPYSEADVWLDEYNKGKNKNETQLDLEIAFFQKKLAKLPATVTSDGKTQLAKDFAADLAKVPGKNNLAFLDYRWAMLLANIKIRKPDIFQNGETLRPLTAKERKDVDAAVRKLGFLKYQREERDKKTGKVTKKEINELAGIIKDITGCDIGDTNLDGFFIPPDMREALKFVPIEKGGEAFQFVWKHLDDRPDKPDGQLRRRFIIQLLNGKVLTAEIICGELRKLKLSEIADAIESDARTKTADKKSKPDGEKFKKLMFAEFNCKKLEGRARYHHDVLRQVWHEVMRGEDPRKKIGDEIFLILAKMPKKRDGCLVIGNEPQRLLDEKPLASQSNNHLVRQRIQVLAGNMQLHSDGTIRRDKQTGNIVARNSLLDDILTEFAEGKTAEDRMAKVARITIEVTRDLQEMSGKGNEAKKQIEGWKRSEHRKIANMLVEKLVDSEGERLKVNGVPVKIGKFINKAWIADDLDWLCPYTVGGSPIMIEPRDLVFPRDDYHRLEREHIIPQSKRVSKAMEAQVVSFRAVNQMKGQRTGLQFIKECRGRPVPGLPGRRVRTEEEYRVFVDGISIKGATKHDIVRRKKRKELLLTEHWNEQEFVPRDLTNTAYVVKLAAEKLRSRFRHLGEKAPSVVYVPGSVTSTFRDKSWRMFRELAAVHPGVKAEMDKGDERFRIGFDGDSQKERKETGKQIQSLGAGLKKFLETFGKESFIEAEKDAKNKELDSLFQDCGHPELRRKVFWLKSSFNLKQAMREITHLHHAVDASTLGLVTHYLVPPQCGSLDGTLAKYIVKGSLNNTERKDFEQIYYSLQLSSFFEFEQERRLRFVGKDYEEQQGNRENFIASCGEELRELIDKDAREPISPDERARFEKLVSELGLPRLFYFDTKSRLHIRDLSNEMKQQLHTMLREAMNQRMAQHVPADMSVMSVKENIKGYEELDDKWVLVHQQERDAITGKPKKKKPQKVAKDKLVGLDGIQGKLAAVKGVLEVTENMAVAFVEQSKDQEEPPPMLVIPLHGAWKRLQKFRGDHPRQCVILIRKGALIRFTTGLHSGPIWKVFGVDNPQKEGPQLKIAAIDTVSLQDEPKLNYKRLTLRNRWQDIELIRPPFTGISPRPTISSG